MQKAKLDQRVHRNNTLSVTALLYKESLAAAVCDDAKEGMLLIVYLSAFKFERGVGRHCQLTEADRAIPA
jgi:hypothetical protein